jgi:hypothetical protein
MIIPIAKFDDSVSLYPIFSKHLLLGQLREELTQRNEILKDLTKARSLLL